MGKAWQASYEGGNLRLFADTADTVFSHPDLISQLGSDEGS